MAAIYPSKRNIALYNYSATSQAMAQGVSVYCVRPENTAWGKWTKFTALLMVRSEISNVLDPVKILQIFTHHNCTGLLEASGRHIGKHSFEQYLQLVGGIFALLGGLNPKMHRLVNADFQLHGQPNKKKVPNLTLVHIITLYLLLHLHLLYKNVLQPQQAITHFALLVVFSLLYTIK